MDELNFCPKCGQRLIEAEKDNKIRKCCDACGYVHWNNPIPVVAAVIEYEGRVLLARNNAWPPRVFALITGFLEEGESPEEAVLREVKEETDLDGTIIDFLGLYAYTERNQLLIVYTVRGSGTVSLGEELAEYRLIEPDKVRAWDFGTGPALKEWIKRHHASGQ